ncbi:unnamed protein product [Urochloa humidicola]
MPMASDLESLAAPRWDSFVCRSGHRLANALWHGHHAGTSSLGGIELKYYWILDLSETQEATNIWLRSSYFQCISYLYCWIHDFTTRPSLHITDVV